jgi:hypothetical protein
MGCVSSPRLKKHSWTVLKRPDLAISQTLAPGWCRFPQSYGKFINFDLSPYPMKFYSYGLTIIRYI